MSKPIVVGINGSAGSDAALSWALDRAAQRNLPVLIMHATDDRWITRDIQNREMLREAGLDLLQKAEAVAREKAAGVKVESQLRHGSAAAALREASAGASMVVVGVHNKHWLDGGPLTDRALQVVSASDCPVAVIPPGPQAEHAASWSASTAPKSRSRP